MQLRYDDTTATSSDALQVIADLLTEMDPLIAVLTIIGARRADVASDVTNPTTWPGATTYGTGVAQEINSPRQLMFEGRDSAGVKWKLSLFGYDEATPPNFRILSGDSAPIAAALAALQNGINAEACVTVGYGLPVLKPYVSFNYNNRYERKQRG